MTISPKDLIPPELMHPDKKDEVIRYVIAQPWPGVYKARVLKGWFIDMGVGIDPRALVEVENSGP